MFLYYKHKWFFSIHFIKVPCLAIFLACCHIWQQVIYLLPLYLFVTAAMNLKITDVYIYIKYYYFLSFTLPNQKF